MQRKRRPPKAAPKTPKGDLMRSAPVKQAYHDNQPSLLLDMRDLLALYRERALISRNPELLYLETFELARIPTNIPYLGREAADGLMKE